MTAPARHLSRFIAAAQSRRGSILILVVALLVLMALIGTAALTTNTIDRYATVQNTNNTEVDLLVQGVVNMAKATIAGDLYDTSITPPVFRQVDTPTSRYDHWDMPLKIIPIPYDPANPNVPHAPPGMDFETARLLARQNDAWLAPRLPSLLRQGPQDSSHTEEPAFDPMEPQNLTDLTKNPVVWDSISAPLESPNGVPAPGGHLFDTPGVFDPITGNFDATMPVGYDVRITNRLPLQGDTADTYLNSPTRLNPLIPDFINTGGKSYPAWRFNFGSLTNNKEVLFIGGDADGDGIVDSGLKKLPIGDINGLTYFYACRIIDNGSAININTAWSRDHEFLGNGSFAFYGNGGGVASTMPQAANFFTTNIGVAEMLRSYNSATATSLDTMQGYGATLTELGGIDAYRFNASAAAQGNLRPSGVATNQTQPPTFGAAGQNVYVDPYGAAPQPWTNFYWTTLGEEVYFGLARRLNNPGYLGDGVKFRRFSTSESAAIAWHFVLANPNASKSILETATATATNPAGTVPTGAAQLDSFFWSADNKIGNNTGAQEEPRYSAFPTLTYPNDGAYQTKLRTFSFSGPQYPVLSYGSFAIGVWFNNNFNYNAEYVSAGSISFAVEAPPRFRNRRAMFTADNPVTNQIPGAIGTLLTCKTSINTGSWPQLYHTFQLVMTDSNPDEMNMNSVPPQPPRPDNPYTAHIPDDGTGQIYMKAVPLTEDQYTYAGMRFTQNLDADTSFGVGTVDTVQQPFRYAERRDTNPMRMFRTVIRDHDATRWGDPAAFYDEVNYQMNPTTVRRTVSLQIPSDEMRKFRSAVAATNAVSMRQQIPGFVLELTQVAAAAGGTISVTDLIKANIDAASGPPNNATPVDVWLYGVERQPYITEVYANTDVQRAPLDFDAGDVSGLLPNTQPYVAIELFYPHETPDLSAATQSFSVAPSDLTGWTIAVVERNRGGPGGTFFNYIPIHTFTRAEAATFPPQTAGGSCGAYGSYIVLENFRPNQAADPVHFRPRSSQLPMATAADSTNPLRPTALPPVRSIYVAELAAAIANVTVGSITPSLTGRELVLLKPQINQSTGALLAIPFKPIDSFDFTGLSQDSALNRSHTWHYQRAGAPAAGSQERIWSCVYPGRYDGGQTTLTVQTRRQQGTRASTWDSSVPTVNQGGTIDTTQAQFHDPFDPTGVAALDLNPAPSLGTRGFNGTIWTDNASDQATYPVTFITQLLTSDQPGWNALTNIANRFPFGRFARNSDILQVPYFCAYCILPPGTTVTNANQRTLPIIEANSTSMDASFCEDTDIDDNFYSAGPNNVIPPTPFTFENLGRFCPAYTGQSNGPPPTAAINDLDPMPAATYRYGYPVPLNNNLGTENASWRYRWATRLFDYITVQDPQADYLPNVIPSDYSLATGTMSVAVSNEGGPPGDPSIGGRESLENNVPLHGLININTASWRVLTAINWTVYPLGDARRDQYHLVPSPIGDGEYDFELGANQVDDNVELAKAITWWRDGIRAVPQQANAQIGQLGPFRSIYDLYRVKAVRTYYSDQFSNPNNPARHEPDDSDGDFSPNNWDATVANQIAPPQPVAPNTAKNDNTREDFEEKFTLLNRVSNLITTRSDSFTVYIVVQGWRIDQQQQKPPELVVQRRAAFIADRSGLNVTGGNLKVVPVPTE